jgi:cob(I)alamin adenosyltransferase
MRIYTRTGDEGTSSLFDGKRVKKYDLRLKTYGELDALNVILGWCRLENDNEKIGEMLSKITNDIFVISSILATEDLTKLPKNLKTIDENSTTEFEILMDELSAEMPELTNFILPGGSSKSLRYHEARVITRKVERFMVELTEQEDIDLSLVKYVNRLSDLFFVLARYANYSLKIEEQIWTS